MLTPEAQAKIAIWQARSLEGTITLEEQREYIILVRGARKSAMVEGKKPRASKSAKAKVDAAALLQELESL